MPSVLHTPYDVLQSQPDGDPGRALSSDDEAATGDWDDISTFPFPASQPPPRTNDD